jgi:uncharacterized RDD family membrane protein YckC
MPATATRAAATTERAGWWTRALAILIDLLGILIVSSVASSIIWGDATAGSPLNLLLCAAYCTYFWSAGGHGQTLGSRSLNIRVVRTDGTYLDPVGAFLRFIGLVFGILIFLVGVVWAAFDARKQGWHDKLAGTYVVKA